MLFDRYAEANAASEMMRFPVVVHESAPFGPSAATRTARAACSAYAESDMVSCRNLTGKERTPRGARTNNKTLQILPPYGRESAGMAAWRALDCNDD